MRISDWSSDVCSSDLHVAVVEQVQVRDQVEALEDEADLLVAQLAALVVRQALDVLAVEREFAAGEGLQQPGDVEEGGLAGTGRTCDGDEFAFLHVQVERTQRVRLDQFGAVEIGSAS